MIDRRYNLFWSLGVTIRQNRVSLSACKKRDTKTHKRSNAMGFFHIISFFTCLDETFNVVKIMLQIMSRNL